MEESNLQTNDQFIRAGTQCDNRCPSCGVDFPLGTLICPKDKTLLSAEIQPELGVDYKLGELIGQGGGAIVFKAFHISLKRTVAIKMLLPHLLLSESAIMRFQREARTISSLEHPNIVRIYDFSRASRLHPFMVMEFVKGGNLEDKVRARGRLSVNQALPLFKQICSALAHVHARGVLHRDLKPSNVLISSDRDGKDQAKLVDFGLAKLLEESTPRLTATGDINGSPLYMSPEQCLAQEMTAASDIYSLGCLMYETLTGAPVFDGRNSMHAMYLQINQSPPPMAHPDGVVGRKLQEIVFKCLEKDPQLRYSSANALISDLTKFEAGTYRSSSIPRRLLKSFSRNAKYAFLVSTLVLLVLVGLSLFQSRKNLEPLSEADKFVREHASQWVGVERIDFANRPLTTAGITYLVQLPRIRKLNLRGTKIDDNSLKVLSRLRNLEELDVSETAVDDEGISHLLKLQSLRVLAMKGCLVTDKGLSTLATLPNLSVLNVENCELSLDQLLLPGQLKSLTIGFQRVKPTWREPWLNSLRQQEHLEQLFLNNERVPESVIAAVSSLPTLRQVSFKEAKLPYVSDFSASHSLVDLDFESAQIKPGLAAHLPPNLQRLVLKNTEMKDSDAIGLEHLPNLRHLDLGFNVLSDACISHLIPLKNLQYLALSGNKISSPGVAKLQDLPQLRELVLFKTPIDDRALTALAKMEQLETLDLACTPISAKGLGSLAGLSHLWLLKLDGIHLKPADLAIVAGLSNLKFLALDDDTVFAPDGSVLPDAFTNLRKLHALRELQINGLKRGQDKALSSLLKCRVAPINFD